MSGPKPRRGCSKNTSPAWVPRWPPPAPMPRRLPTICGGTSKRRPHRRNSPPSPNRTPAESWPGWGRRRRHFLRIGFLPLSPFLALAVALRLRNRIRKLSGERVPLRPSVWWGGFAGAVPALAAFALPAPLTRHWERMAASEGTATALNGVQQLRRFGHRATLLQDCYGATHWSSDNPWKFSFGGVPAPADMSRTLFPRHRRRLQRRAPPTGPLRPRRPSPAGARRAPRIRRSPSSNAATRCS